MQSGVRMCARKGVRAKCVHVHRLECTRSASAERTLSGTRHGQDLDIYRKTPRGNGLTRDGWPQGDTTHRPPYRGGRTRTSGREVRDGTELPTG
eukprot:15430114-Alexandrium_andersonii.AAC.1